MRAATICKKPELTLEGVEKFESDLDIKNRKEVIVVTR